ncbi:unnamed protein product [Amoebophrya sp. A25]|nr:unnamed protein product [Amoebophrya sp. A25]|eukprot:GSA25T00010778001.1
MNKRCSGGELDVDATEKTARPVENIAFQKCAPSGKYKVIVNTYKQLNGGYIGVQPKGYPWTSDEFKGKMLSNYVLTRRSANLDLQNLELVKDVPFQVLVKFHPGATVEIVGKYGNQVAGSAAIVENGGPIAMNDAIAKGKPEKAGHIRWTTDVLEFTYAPGSSDECKMGEDFAELIPEGAGDAWTQATEEIDNNFKTTTTTTTKTSLSDRKTKLGEEKGQDKGNIEVILSWKHASRRDLAVGLAVNACCPKAPGKCPPSFAYSRIPIDEGRMHGKPACNSGKWSNVLPDVNADQQLRQGGPSQHPSPSRPSSGVEVVTFTPPGGMDYSTMEQFRIRIEPHQIKSDETHTSVEYLVSVKQDGQHKIVWKGRASAFLQPVMRPREDPTKHHTFVGQFSLNREGTICGVHPVVSQTGPKPFPVC